MTKLETIKLTMNKINMAKLTKEFKNYGLTNCG